MKEKDTGKIILKNGISAEKNINTKGKVYNNLKVHKEEIFAEAE